MQAVRSRGNIHFTQSVAEGRRKMKYDISMMTDKAWFSTVCISVLDKLALIGSHL